MTTKPWRGDIYRVDLAPGQAPRSVRQSTSLHAQ
jgi:hypothetical protein